MPGGAGVRALSTALILASAALILFAAAEREWILGRWQAMRYRARLERAATPWDLRVLVSDLETLAERDGGWARDLFGSLHTATAADLESGNLRVTATAAIRGANLHLDVSLSNAGHDDLYLYAPHISPPGFRSDGPSPWDRLRPGGRLALSSDIAWPLGTEFRYFLVSCTRADRRLFRIGLILPDGKRLPAEDPASFPLRFYVPVAPP
jgi:hypothetical protein